MRWYISAAAVKQYMSIQGYVGSEDGPVFDAAAIELEGLCDEAELKKEWSHEGKPRQLWQVRAEVRERRQRLEFTVAMEPRPEGPLPQLVRVRLKG